MPSSDTFDHREPVDKYLDWAVAISLSLTIATIPFPPKVNSASIIVLGVAALACAIRFRKPLRLPFFFYALIGMYVVHLVWLMSTEDRSHAARILETELPIIGFPLIFLFLRISPRTLTIAHGVFIIMAFSLLLFSFWQLLEYISSSPYASDTVGYLWIHLRSGYIFYLNMLSWKFSHPTFFILIFSYAFLILISIRPWKPWIVVFAVLFFLSMIVFVLLSGSRFGVAMTGLCLGMTIIIRLKWSLRWVTISFAVVFLCIFIWAAGNYQRLDPKRYQYAVMSIDAFMDKPILGYGTGAQQAIMKDTVLASRLGFEQTLHYGLEVDHPHNQILSELLQFGIVGTIPLFVFLISAFAFAIGRNNLTMLSVLFAVSATLMIESPFQSNKGVVPLLMAIILASEFSKAHPKGRELF